MTPSELFSNQVKELLALNICEQSVSESCLKRLGLGAFTRDENPESHFCTYFAAIDHEAKEVFIGHHKKSGLWLFNGGHVDKGEMFSETLEREISEEWGLAMKSSDIGKPGLLTITPINNPTKQRCKEHFDVWYFVNVTKDTFTPDPEKLAEEFYKTEWLNLTEARKFIQDPNTQTALEVIEKNYFISKQ